MEKTVNIGGKEMRMRATALIPRLYRFKFGRDLIADMRQLEKAHKKASEAKTEEEKNEAGFSILDLTIFENIAWVMLKNAGEDIPEDPDEWLDGIDGVFSIYEVLPTILELWGANQLQTSVPKKV